ncbi:MAG: nicotinamide-nucleotide amidohydrolase family protein [Propionibacteriales bacterium]|nr:nicotinamide-nucleotide amidohydrolase family protein [Propionibacteriales bacterium]
MTPLPVAVEVVRLLRERGETIACAESLTGGLLCAALVDVPGASDVVVGGVVSYATRVKRDVLGVDARLLAEHGAVDPGTAVQMADHVRRLLDADWGLSTTGVAGPGPSEDKPAGTVFVGLDGPGHRLQSEPLHLDGDRDAVRRGTVGAALSSLVARLCE